MQVRLWWLWVLILGPIPLIVRDSNRDRTMAAGARWFKYRSSWLEIYDLVEVRMMVSGWTHDLWLTDSEGRRVHVPISSIQVNPRLWALVYNGILHSAHAREIKTNRLARKDLYLPPNDPPTPEQRCAAPTPPRRTNHRAAGRWERCRERRREIKRNRPKIV